MGGKAREPALSNAIQGSESETLTGKFRGYFGGNDPKSSKVGFVPNEHGDDVWARVLAQLFYPGLDVAEGRGLCHVIQ